MKNLHKPLNIFNIYNFYVSYIRGKDEINYSQIARVYNWKITNCGQSKQTCKQTDKKKKVMNLYVMNFELWSIIF